MFEHKVRGIYHFQSPAKASTFRANFPNKVANEESEGVLTYTPCTLLAS